MPAARINFATRFLFRIHPWIYRTTGGRLLGNFGGTPILLLTTTGRKSGAPRTNALMFLETAGGFAVAASYAGEPRHPAWYLNLRGHPRAQVQVRDRVVPVRARETEGEERARLWAGIVAQDPSFAVYEERTSGVREIPVILLEPDGQAAGG